MRWLNFFPDENAVGEENFQRAHGRVLQVKSSAIE